MDIEKAIEFLEEQYKHMSCYFGSAESCQLHNNKISRAIDFLKELQQYRQIGTVEHFAALESQMKPHIIDENCCPKRNCNKCDKYRKELEKYHEIGTVDEFRAAMEKQIPKEPLVCGIARQGLNGDNIHTDAVSYQDDCCECPVCGSFLGYVVDCSKAEYQCNFCQSCGQALKWGD